jgi:tetratricopeptide (TPR) repeat protein
MKRLAAREKESEREKDRGIRLFVLVCLCLCVGLWLLGQGTDRASAQTPYTTWAWGPGGFLVNTQDAYSPLAELDLPLSDAEDMFITADGVIYVADTGNGRIVQVDGTEIVAEYGVDLLDEPTGVYVDQAGTLFIADAGQNAIVILDRDGNLVTQFGRPDEPLFGLSREFLPRKIAVDARENLYIISEGSVDGIVQMNTNGDFIGYFGSNAATMSLKMILQRLFLTKEQLAQFIKNEAASPTNLAIDPQSLVFTITGGIVPNQSIKKFTIAGKNIFPLTIGSDSFRDIHVSDTGLVLAVDAEGAIFEYDHDGTLLFAFVAHDTGDQRLGTILNPTAIGRYQDRIYVLDKDKNAIVVYQTTAFAEKVHAGVRLYMEGFYPEAKPYFEEVLTLNGSFIMAYQAIADAEYKAGNYQSALAAYRLAEDRRGYSEAFWELRNVVLQRFLTQFLLGAVGLSLALRVGRRLENRGHWLDPARHWLARLGQVKLVDDLMFMFRFIRYPADSFYYIKKDLRGSLGFAALVYVWIVVVRVATLYVTGFIFNPFASVSDIPIENEIVLTLGLLALWMAANYLVSTISDGEGRIRDVVIGTAYSLFPYALFALPLAIISNGLTLNEIFVYTFSQNLIWLWTGIMLVIMVKEVHNYTAGETVRNVLVTLFTMGLFVLSGYILYVLFNQLFDFISAVMQELSLRG